ncbi:MAG: phosphodiesterase [Alphaproteobacteria bacterium]
MLIAQITDMHVMPEGELMGEVVPTNAMLEAAVARLNALTPAVDLILATGDLTEGGGPEAYAALRRILAQATAPVFMVPGNHDKPDAMRAAFPEVAYWPADGSMQYVVEDWPLRLIGLDTRVANHPGGDMDADRLAWLTAQLDAKPGAPTLIFMHHPPFRTGVWWMDAIGLKGADEFEATVRRYDTIEGVVCGHIHRPITRRWGGTVATVAPSTAHQMMLDLEGTNFLQSTKEPPAVALHHWTPETGLVTHTLYIDDFGWYDPPDHHDKAMMARARAFFEKSRAEMGV